MPTFSRKPLAAVVVMLNLWPGAHLMANEFSLVNDQIEVDGVGTVALASDGSLDNISATINDPLPGNIPDINFTLTNNNSESGQYDVRLGLIIQQQGTSRRLEAIMGVVRVTVDGTGDISNIDVLTSEPLTVTIRQDGVTLEYSNDADIGVIQTAGANVTVSASAINNALVNANPVIAEMVNALTLSGHYNYRIAMQPVAGDFSVGTVDTDSNFMPLARMQSACDLDGTSTSGFNFMLGDAGSFSSAYAVHGVLSLGGATSPSSGFSPLTEQCTEAPSTEPEPDATAAGAAADADESIARAQDAIAAGDGDAVQQEVDDAVASLQEALAALQQQRIGEGSTNQSQLLALAATFTDLGEMLASAASTLPESPALDAVDTLNNNLLELLDLLTEKTDTLTSTDKQQIQAAVIQTLEANRAQLAAQDSDDQAALLRKRDVLTQVLVVQAALGIDLSGTQVEQQRELNAELLAQFDSSNAGGANPFVFTPISTVPSTFLGSTLGNYNVDTGPINPGVSDLSALSIPESPGAILGSDGLITLRTTDNRAFRYQFTSVAFVPTDALQNGIYNAPNGALYSIDDGVIVEFAAAPANLQAFNSAVMSLGYSAAVEGPGVVNIELDGGERLSAAFRFEDVIDATGECSSVTFVAPMGQPTSANYVFTAQCNNGITQTLVPVVLEQSLYNTIINSGLSVSNSRDTGVLQVENVGAFRPDFFVYPLSPEDAVFLNNNAYLEGVALQAGDFNNDGKTDYRLLSVRGKQTLWGL